MFGKRWVVLLPLAIITCLLLAACVESAETGPFEVDQRFGGFFNYASSSEPQTVDTHCQSDFHVAPLENLVMESLISLGEGYSVVPMLAESWEISHNDTVYTFYLRRGIKFHNGKEMTSEDVIASLERYLKVGYRASAFDLVTSYKALDDYTIQVQIAQPTMAFLDNLAMPAGAVHIYPREIIQDRAQNDLTWDDLVGTGPYQLVEHKPGDMTVLRRFEDYQPYPGRRDGLGGAKIAFFDEIRFHIVPNYTDRFVGLQNGVYDWIEGKGQDVETVDADPNLVVAWDAHAGAHHLLFNHSISPTDNLQFRQSVRAVLEIEEFGSSAWEGCSQCFRTNHSLWPEYSHYFINDRFCKTMYDQNNLGIAKALLEESNYADEELVCVASTRISPSLNVCGYLQEVLAEKLEIDLKVELLEHNAFLDRLYQVDTWNFTVMFFPNTVEIAPWWYTSDHESSGVSLTLHNGYRSPDMDATYARLDLATTFEERLGYLEDIQRKAYEDVIDLKLWDVTVPWFHRSNIQGFSGWYVPRFYGVWRE